MKRVIVFNALLLFMGAEWARGQVPQLISYQGRLTTPAGTNVTDGNYSLTFKLYDAVTGGTTLWTETETAQVSGGLFSVNLGSVAPLCLFFDRPYWLGVTIAAGSELTPRTALTSTAYSYMSRRVTPPMSLVTTYGPVISVTDSGTGAGISAQSADGASGAVTGENYVTQNVGKLAGQNVGVYGYSSDSAGVKGESTNGTGVYGSHLSQGSYGIGAVALNKGHGPGLYGSSGPDALVPAQLPDAGIYGYSDNSDAIFAYTPSTAYGVYGMSDKGVGVQGFSNGNAAESGVYGASYFGSGVSGWSLWGTAVQGLSRDTGAAVVGQSLKGDGVHGQADGSASSRGVYGESSAGTGVWGTSSSGDGLRGESNGANKSGIFAINTNPSGFAGFFTGNVYVNGTLGKAAGAFKIDHPIDPANKYLQHSFVESPDMKDIYDGNVTLDATGEATVVLPDWFQALNQEFRYQLTAIGAPGPNLYIKQEVQGNRFVVAGGSSGMKVSWQVTGIRHDDYANAHRIQVEVDKQGTEKGKYLSPVEHGQPESMGIYYEERSQGVSNPDMKVKE